MKKLILTFTLSAFAVINTNAQTNQNIEAKYIGEIKLDYDETIKQVPQQFRSQVADVIKSEIDNGIFLDYNLKNNGKISSFILEEKISNAQGGIGMIEQQIRSSEGFPYYKDFTQNPVVFYKETDIMGKKFLIKDVIPDLNWKITREKSEIAGFKVTKAEGIMQDSIKVNAWYAPEIAIKDGPVNISGLPGLIIKVSFESNGAELIYTLKDLKITDKEIKMTIPTKGTVVTQEEFNQEIKALMDKFREEHNNGIDTK